MAFDELAQRLFGARRAESDAILTDATTGTIHGVALTDSEGGAVTVEITADVTAPEPLEVGGETYFADAGVGIEIPTSESVRAGDEVLVSTYGAGTMRSPVVTAAVGSGDRMAAAVQDAHDLAASVESIAQEAKDVAEATGQHFWPDTDGVHVTEVTQDEWSDSTSTSYHSGANVLLNALGQLFRDGLNNLLSLTTGATHTETFQIRSDEDYYYELTYRPMAVESVTINGTATSDYTWTNSGHVVGSGKLGTLALGYDTWSANPGATLSVTYRTSPAMTVWDGLGNLAANVMSYFTADEIGLGGNIFSDPHGTSRGAAVRFFGATDEQGASLTSGIQRDSAADYISYVDTIGLTGTTTDEGAALSNGCISDYGIEAMGYLYDDSESSNDYRVESTATLNARSRSSDAYDAADATARLGVKTMTIGDSGEYSYVTLGDGTNEAEVPLVQAIVGLTQPASSYTGANGTATASSNGWRLTYFNSQLGGTRNNPVSSYWTFSNGVITVLKDCLLEFSGVMGWTDNVAGSRGFGLFVGATAPGSGREWSSFQFFPSNVGTRKCVTFPPLLLPLSAGEHVAVGRYENSGAVYVNGANYSWITIRVVEDRSS